MVQTHSRCLPGAKGEKRRTSVITQNNLENKNNMEEGNWSLSVWGGGGGLGTKQDLGLDGLILRNSCQICDSSTHKQSARKEKCMKLTPEPGHEQEQFSVCDPPCVRLQRSKWRVWNPSSRTTRCYLSQKREKHRWRGEHKQDAHTKRYGSSGSVAAEKGRRNNGHQGETMSDLLELKVEFEYNS